MDEKELTTLDSIKQRDDELITKIVEESDVDKLKDLTHVFNAFQTKRQILRVNALNDVQDALVAQMLERLEKQPHNFDNNDIANWMNVVQRTLDSSQKNVKTIDETPAISYQQNNQINVNVDSTQLSRESREKILNVVQLVLQNSENTENTPVYNDGEEEVDTDGQSEPR